MVEHILVYLEIDNKAQLKNSFVDICSEVEKTSSRSELTELYRRAGYLITLVNDPFWEKNFFEAIDEVRRIANEEFMKTINKINLRAEKLGTVGDYNELWSG